jgi:hypothetical protein
MDAEFCSDHGDCRPCTQKKRMHADGSTPFALPINAATSNTPIVAPSINQSIKTYPFLPTAQSGLKGYDCSALSAVNQNRGKIEELKRL